MASETTLALISSLIDPIRERALWYATHNFVMSQLVTTFTDRSGMADRKNSQYSEGVVSDNLGELDPLVPDEFERALLSTLTPKEIGKQHIITDRRLETDPENIVADAIRNIGYSIGKKVEIDMLGSFSQLTGGVLGSENSAMSLSRLYAGRARLERQGVVGPYVTVLDSYQYLDIHAELTDLSQPAPLAIRELASRSYYVTQIADFLVVVSSLVPRTAVQNEKQTLTFGAGTADGGAFKLAFAEQETASLAYDATAQQIEDALEALPNIGDDINGDPNVSVTGNVGGPFTVEFVGDLAGENVPLLTVPVNTVNDGGVAMALTPAESQAGKNYARGAMFSRDALALDLRRPLRLEPMRFPAGRYTEFNATMIYAYGGWNPKDGVQLKSDASMPLS